MGSDAGVKAVGVTEATDPSVLDNFQDEGKSASLAGSDELLCSKGGCPVALSFFANAVRSVVSNIRIAGLEGATHTVEADAGGKRVLVRCVGEDQSRQAAGVGTTGDGVKYGEDGFA